MLLKQLDMLSPRITLYYKKKNKHASAISGILTIITFASILGFILPYIINYINRENPTAYFFNRYVDDIGTFSLKDSNFFHYIQLIEGRSREPRDLDFNKIEIMGIGIPMEYFINIRNFAFFDHWVYGKCDDKTDIKKVENLLNKTKFFKSACIKKFYKSSTLKYYDIDDENFEWPIIEHGSSHPESKVFGLIIKKCTNTSLRLRNFGPCSSEEEIHNYALSNLLSFTVIDHYVDILNYKNPISQFLFTLNSAISPDAFKINNLNFYPALVKSYNNLFTDKTNEISAYTFHQNEQVTSSLENSEYLGAYYLWLQNTQQYYERRYHKLTEALPEIGGVINAIMMIARFINYLISRFNLLSDTKDLISDVLKQNYSVYENIKKSKSIKQFLENNKQTENENLTIKKFESGQNIKRFKFPENLEEEKDEDNKIINKRINIINNNLGEETNRINKNHEDSKEKVISKQPSSIYESFSNKRTKSIIRRNYSLLEKKDFNCFNYLCYLIFCKQINSDIKKIEELRRLIISEESIFNNYFNVYKLLEENKGK